MYYTQDGKKIKCEKEVTTLDNRDESTTWLWFDDDKHFVEIDPWSLVQNVIENGYYDDTIRQSLIKTLKDLQQQVSEENDKS